MNPDKSKKQIYLLLFGLFPEAFLEGIVIPLFPFMVRFLYPTAPETDIGFYTGMLGSAFYLPLFIMNLIWGAASDTYGRKPIIVLGIVITILTTSVLAFSQLFWITFMCRFVAGLFGSNSTVAKGMIGDVARDQKARAWGYALYGSVYGLSSMVGPLTGGLLANPAILYPNLFDPNGVFGRYPYALVCSIVSILSTISLVLTVMYLSENKKQNYNRIDGEDEDVLMTREDSAVSEGSISPTTVKLRRRSGTYENLMEIENEQPKQFQFLTWNTMGPIILYMALAYTNMNYATALPLFFATSKSLGGLGLNSRDTALQFGASAFTKLLFQWVLFQPLLQKVGSPKKAYKLALFLYIPGHFLVPFVAGLDPLPSTILSVIIMLSFGMCEAIGYVSVILMITESQSPANLGIAHGFASTMAALVRAICPAVSGGIWVWGVKLGWPWLVFYSGGFVALFGFLAASD